MNIVLYSLKGSLAAGSQEAPASSKPLARARPGRDNPAPDPHGVCSLLEALPRACKANGQMNARTPLTPASLGQAYDGGFAVPGCGATPRHVASPACSSHQVRQPPRTALLSVWREHSPFLSCCLVRGKVTSRFPGPFPKQKVLATGLVYS